MVSIKKNLRAAVVTYLAVTSVREKIHGICRFALPELRASHTCWIRNIL